MQLSTKHPRQQTVTLYDFTGGLNSTAIPEMIGENQLAEAVNVELDRVTGSLKTCCGTATVFKPLKGLTVDCLMYDRNNNVNLFTSGQGVYKTRLIDMNGTVPQDSEKIGELTGDLFPIYAAWENGLLITSGGKLQYWDGIRLNRVDKSPNVCNGVFVADGCVIIWWKDELRFSAIGDYKDWEEDNNDDSASKFIQIGYKDGGEITGVVNLSQDIVIIKNNGRVYRLSGKYPNWVVTEISRNIDCINRLSYCAVANAVFILGRDSLQLLETTTAYGDVKAMNVAKNVVSLFYQLSLDKTRIIFIPPLNQLWIVGSLERIIVYDLTYNAFFERKFNHPITDICISKNTVLIARKDKVTRLAEGIFLDEAYSDDAAEIEWSFQTRSLMSYNNFLVKRAIITYIPFTDDLIKAEIEIGGITIPVESKKIKNQPIHTLVTPIYNDKLYIYPVANQFVSARQIYRDRTIKIKGYGKGAIMLNKIEFSITEVGV